MLCLSGQALAVAEQLANELDSNQPQAQDTFNAVPVPGTSGPSNADVIAAISALNIRFDEHVESCTAGAVNAVSSYRGRGRNRGRNSGRGRGSNSNHNNNNNNYNNNNNNRSNNGSHVVICYKCGRPNHSSVLYTLN